MDAIAERIKNVKITNNLTSEQFAARILCDKRTIQRYENGDSNPNIYLLMRIALEFGVSTDYLLGLSNKMELMYEAEEVALLYQRYKKMMTNPICNDEDYYWITMNIKDDKTYITSVKTQWIGFTDDNRKEIRKARPVIPENVIELCKQKNQIPVIINKVSEIGIFFLFGGEAIIRDSLCKKHLTYILDPIIVDVENINI